MQSTVELWCVVVFKGTVLWLPHICKYRTLSLVCVCVECATRLKCDSIAGQNQFWSVVQPRNPDLNGPCLKKKKKKNPLWGFFMRPWLSSACCLVDNQLQWTIVWIWLSSLKYKHEIRWGHLHPPSYSVQVFVFWSWFRMAKGEAVFSSSWASGSPSQKAPMSLNPDWWQGCSWTAAG